MVDVAEAKIIAYQEIKNMGYNPDAMNIEVDKKNKLWKQQLSQEPSLLEMDDLKWMNLEKNEYYAVYYCPKVNPGEYLLGGDCWIFIDSNDGKVLGNFCWE